MKPPLMGPSLVVVTPTIDIASADTKSGTIGETGRDRERRDLQETKRGWIWAYTAHIRP